jgi:hypothetical protein
MLTQKPEDEESAVKASEHAPQPLALCTCRCACRAAEALSRTVVQNLGAVELDQFFGAME